MMEHNYCFDTDDWAEKIPADFYRLTDNLMPPKSIGLNSAKGLDFALRTGLASLISAISIPAGYSANKVACDVEAIKKQNSLDQKSGTLFKTYRKPNFQINRVKRPFGIKEGIFEKISWQSTYSDEQDYQQAPLNKNATAYLWRHGDKPRPTVVVVHGFIASWWITNEYLIGLKDLYTQGCDVVLKTLPHHGERRKSWGSISGLGYVSGGIQHMNHAIVQSTYDIRALIDCLIEIKNVPKLGITGLSLGGYTTALMAGLEPRLSFALPIVPIISIPDAMMEWKPLDTKLIGIMNESGLSMTELRKTVSFHSPLAVVPKIDSERLMIIAGYGDLMASPKHSLVLQRHWQDCQVHWFEGSHVLHLGRSKILRARKEFLRKIEFSIN